MRLWNSDPYVFQFARVIHKVPPRKCFATIIVKATFRLVDGATVVPLSVPDPELPEVVRLLMPPAEEAARPALPMGDIPLDPPPGIDALPTGLNRYEQDFAPFKPRADVLLAATAHAPGGQPAPAVEVGVQVGTMCKRLHVVGDHHWVEGRLTPFQPFVSMPIRYDRALGGPGDRRNPVGVGRIVVADEAGRATARMPNIMAPGEAVASPSAPWEPAGFGPLGMEWAQRTDGRMGTYDKEWLRTQWPWFPKDFDWSRFNAAPLDQQVDGYLRGDEEITLKNLHPANPVLRSRLPGVRVRCFFKDFIEYHEEPDPEPAPMAPPPKAAPAPQPKPPGFDPGPEIRADLPGTPAGDALAEMLSVPLPTPDIGLPHEEPPPPAAAVATGEKGPSIADRVLQDPPGVFQWREVPLVLDTLFIDAEEEKVHLVWRGTVALRSLRMREVGDVYVASEPLAEPPRPAESHREDLERLKQRVRDAMTPKGDGLIPLDQMEEQIMGRVAEIESRYAAFEAAMKAKEAEVNAAAERIKAAAGKLPKPPGPPVTAADADAMASIATGLAHAKARGFEPPSGLDETLAFIQTGKPAEEHPQAKRIKGEIDRVEAFAKEKMAEVAAELEKHFGKTQGEFFRTREEVLAALDEGRDLRAGIAMRLDLSGIDFAGRDLRNANFMFADLRGSRFTGARLDQANLFRAVLDDVDFSGTTLSMANFMKATFARNRFAGALIDTTNFNGCDLSGADFSGARGKVPVFIEARLSGARFAGAQIEKGAFVKARLDGADFSGATLVSPQFLGVKAAGAIFRKAVCERFFGGGKSDFRNADFRLARLPDSNLEEALLAGADFSGAVLTRTILNEVQAERAVFFRADMTDAQFEEAVLTDARMAEANLLRASFERADLTRTDLRGSNLYEALFIHPILEETAIGGAFVKRTLIDDHVRR